MGDFAELRRVDQVEVIDVVSPYTILLANGRIARLSGIEIPNALAEEPGEWAVTARDILKDLIEGQRVSLYQTKKKDWGQNNRMGHMLVHIQRHNQNKDDQAWTQGVLLSLGLARVRTSMRNPEMAVQMYALEAKARAEKIGLWADERFAVLTPETAESHIGKFAIIEGPIKSVTLKKNRIFMNFGGNWRDDFTVTIPSEGKRGFSKLNLDPLGWGGKTVRVRGYLESINGPSLEIDHPAAIELLEKPEPQMDADER